MGAVVAGAGDVLPRRRRISAAGLSAAESARCRRYFLCCPDKLILSLNLKLTVRGVKLLF
jgi:hypothetical protein